MRLSLGQLLTSLFAIILLVVIAQGIYAVTSLNVILGSTQQIVEKRVYSFITMGQINADISDIRVAQSNYRSSNESEKADFSAALTKANETLARDRKKYEPLMVDQGDHDLYEKFSKQWAEAERFWQQVKTLDDNGSESDAKKLFMGDSFAAYNKAGDAIQDAVDDLAGDCQEFRVRARGLT